MPIQIKRVYDAPAASDGKRILIDRLWPRGLSKDRAQVDIWLKDIAPSTQLRQWFTHDAAKWEQFQERYLTELEANESAVNQLLTEIKSGSATLLYAAHDELHNHALVLQKYLKHKSVKFASGSNK